MVLNAQQIHNEFIQEGFKTPYELYLFNTIDSTNRYLKEVPSNHTLAICCAEEQTQGRGRFNRQWHSPPAENIYCSSRWNLPCDLSKLAGLSLITSLAVLATVNELGSKDAILVKWPNDILWEDKKLSGSLIECVCDSQDQTQVIIGIGLNVNSDTEKYPLADKPWCSLYTMHNQMFDRNRLICRLIMHLDSYLKRFIQNGFSHFMEEWNKSDYLAGKYITINQPNGSLSGKACGVTHLGQLIIEDNTGDLHYIASGDASLKSLD